MVFYFSGFCQPGMGEGIYFGSGGIHDFKHDILPWYLEPWPLSHTEDLVFLKLTTFSFPYS